jgi:hypothetical protein
MNNNDFFRILLITFDMLNSQYKDILYNQFIKNIMDIENLATEQEAIDFIEENKDNIDNMYDLYISKQYHNNQMICQYLIVHKK